MEHITGKYVISDRPMTEDEWIRARATIVDVTPVEVWGPLEARSKVGR
jgi:hypothetical protein